ncbi:hypothetical protein PR048_006643 [Dryococelus australis]|uniref:HTH psq-type domain-containing protein n=1 Tax=Dryococelus australis TaxID=614101 RepID=A0ABQ9IBI4_9NEOP|nr:hypothetical protein PR048_006643 [Dryococelus australis]
MDRGRNPKRKKWEKEQMILAVKAVQAGTMAYKSPAKQFGVPKSTVERYVKNSEPSLDDLVNVLLGRRLILTWENKKELVEYCVEMDKQFYGLRKHDIEIMAFQLDISNGKNTHCLKKTEAAGKKWMASFLKLINCCLR